MKRLSYLVLLAPLLLSGCLLIPHWGKPTNQINKIQAKIEKTEDKSQVITQKEQSIANEFLFSANYSLSLDGNPSSQSILAKELTDKALNIVGPPPMDEVLKLRLMVTNLLSTNLNLKAEGEKTLLKKEKEVIKLQEEKLDLIKTLEQQRSKYDMLADKIAGYAATYITITNWIKYILWFIGIAFFMELISKILPPPYNLITSVISMFFGSVIRLGLSFFPAAKTFGGVVVGKTHDLSETTLKSLVSTIEKVKKDKPDVFEDTLEPILKDKTNTEIRSKIIDIKKDLGHI